MTLVTDIIFGLALIVVLFFNIYLVGLAVSNEMSKQKSLHNKNRILVAPPQGGKQ